MCTVVILQFQSLHFAHRLGRIYREKKYGYICVACFGKIDSFKQLYTLFRFVSFRLGV